MPKYIIARQTYSIHTTTQEAPTPEAALKIVEQEPNLEAIGRTWQISSNQCKLYPKYQVVGELFFYEKPMLEGEQ